MSLIEGIDDKSVSITETNVFMIKLLYKGEWTATPNLIKTTLNFLKLCLEGSSGQNIRAASLTWRPSL